MREFRRGRTRRRRDSRSLGRAEDLTTSSSSLCAVIGRRISQVAVAAGIRGQVSKARSRFLTVLCPSMSCPSQRGVSGGVKVDNVTALFVALAYAHAGHRGMPKDRVRSVPSLCDGPRCGISTRVSQRHLQATARGCRSLRRSARVYGFLTDSNKPSVICPVRSCPFSALVYPIAYPNRVGLSSTVVTRSTADGRPV